MTGKISKETVEKVAGLARLELSQKEVELYTQQLGAILDYIELLGEVKTAGIEPLVNPLEGIVRTFDDEVVKSPGATVMLESAPEALYDNYKVPQVVGG